MKSPIVNIVAALVIPAIAALGGAMAVYGEYDDSPGGTLIGILLVLGTMVLGVRAALRTSHTPQPPSS